MEKPDWKQHAQNVLPLAISAGLVGATALLPHGPADPAGLAALVTSLGTNLAASGLAALCRIRGLRAGKEYSETLANHDILRLIRTAWGEAAAASLEAYAAARHARPTDPLSIVQDGPSPAFLEVLEKVKPADFVPEAITVSTVRHAIESSRRSLLAGPEPESTAAAGELAGQLKSALIDSVVDAISAKLGPNDGAVLPPDFRAFLNGDDPGFPEGLLGQLCIYVAFHLKTDHRAQAAVLHFTLQEVADRQAAIAALCDTILQSQSEFQKRLLQDFEARNQLLCDRLKSHIGQAFNDFVRPRLDAPFATPGDRPPFTFTYRARATPLVGREAPTDALIEFMGDPSPGLWTVVSGPAGTGKSRLAAELVARVRDPAAGSDGVPPGQWRAGFFNATVVEPDPRQREALAERIDRLLAHYGLTRDQMFQ